MATSSHTHTWFRHWIIHWSRSHQWAEFLGGFSRSAGENSTVCWASISGQLVSLLSFVEIQHWLLQGQGAGLGMDLWSSQPCFILAQLHAAPQGLSPQCTFCWAFSCSVLKITRQLLTFRIHFSTLKHHNSLFKETLGRVLTWSMLCRKESSFLLFFQHDFHWHDQAGKKLIGWQPRTAMQYL